MDGRETFLGGLAREPGVNVLRGSILEAGPSPQKLHNTSTFFGPRKPGRLADPQE